MAETAANLPTVGVNDPRPGFDWDGAAPFLAAGSVLFASLVVGSSASLVLAGSNRLIASILYGFLEYGLWTLGGFLAAVAAALTVACLRRHRPGA